MRMAEAAPKPPQGSQIELETKKTEHAGELACCRHLPYADSCSGESGVKCGVQLWWNATKEGVDLHSHAHARTLLQAHPTPAATNTDMQRCHTTTTQGAKAPAVVT